MSIVRRVTLLCAPTIVAVAALAAPVLAHIDPDPVEAPAGSEQSVGFTVQHGCAGSSTVELRMRLPGGVANAAPEAPTGWTGSVEDNVVSFTGGPLSDDLEETFRVRMVLPLTPGATIYFPFVQRCEVGEIAWIDIPSDGSGTELDEPAPAMTLTAALPGTTAMPATTIAAPSTTVAVTTTLAATTTTAETTKEPSTIQPPTVSDGGIVDSTSPETAPTTSATQSSADPIASTTTDPVDDDAASGNAGTIVLVVVILIVIAGGVAVLIRARRAR